MSRRERYTNPFVTTGGHSPALYASMGVPIGTPIGISPHYNPMIGGFGIPVIQQSIQQPACWQQRGIYDPFGNDYPANAPISRSQYHEMQRMAPVYHTGERNWSSNPFDDGQYTYANHASFETPQTRQYDRQMYRTYEDTRRTAHQNIRPSVHPRTENRCEPNCKSFLDKVSDRINNNENQCLRGGNLSKEEREYAENHDNFDNEESYEDTQQDIKEGDEYCRKKKYGKEGHSHRTVQDTIKNLKKKKNDYSRPTKESKNARNMNNLYIHSGGVLRYLERKGYTFNDSFEKVGRNYYLTLAAKKFLDSKQYPYESDGIASIINPNIDY